jgi:hypothetical protein
MLFCMRDVSASGCWARTQYQSIRMSAIFVVFTLDNNHNYNNFVGPPKGTHTK